MEDLLNHFVSHIHNNISPNLSNAIRQTINQTHKSSYEEIETSIKQCIKFYLQTISDKEQLEIATKLYNGFIQMDDKNIIQGIKLIYRYYSFYHQLKLKGCFNKWRINSLKLKCTNQTKLNINNSNFNDNDNFNKTNINHLNYIKSKDFKNTIQNKNNNHNQPIKNINNSINNPHLQSNHLPNDNTQGYFNNLYLDQHQRTYHKNFTHELTDVTKIDQCTFAPNSNYVL